LGDRWSMPGEVHARKHHWIIMVICIFMIIRIIIIIMISLIINKIIIIIIIIIITILYYIDMSYIKEHPNVYIFVKSGKRYCMSMIIIKDVWN